MVSTYRETLRPPAFWWFIGLMFAVTIGWIVVVVSSWTPAVALGAITAAAVSIGFWTVGSLSIAVDEGELRVGRARLDAASVGRIESLDTADFRQLMGVGADARAFLCTRAYAPYGIKVEVVDERDPVPYWLISTRHRDRLVASLTRSGKDQDITIGEQNVVEED